MDVVRKKVDALVRQNKTLRKTLHEQEDMNIGYDYYASIFSMCCKNILMLDFDNKDGWNLDDVTKALDLYAQEQKERELEYLFDIYLTDRGVHAFVINKYMDYSSEEALNMMLSLGSDEMYIGYVEIRGYCVRLNPKIRGGYEDEFIAKSAGILIGYGEPDQHIENVLKFHLSMIEFFKKEYELYKNDYTQKTYIPELDAVLPTPSEEVFEEVTRKIVEILNEYKIYGEGKYIRKEKYSDSDRVIEVYRQDDLRLGYDIYNGLWHVCTLGMLMVDFDTKNKSNVVNILRNFVSKNKEYKFKIYETDNGVHAYITNRYIYYNSEESKWILETLTPNNTSHINTVMTYSHCIRVGPKIWKNGLRIEKDIIQQSIVEKQGVDSTVYVGEGDDIPEFAGILSAKDNIVSYIKKQYRNSYNQMVIPYKFPHEDIYSAKPSDYYINAIRNEFLILLDEKGLKRKNMTNLLTLRPNTLGSKNRYIDLLSENILRDGLTAEEFYSRMSVTRVNKTTNKNVVDIRLKDDKPLYSVDYLVKYIVLPLISKTGCDQIILLRGPQVPFVLGYDTRTKILYIMFYDLMMIDWDIAEGVPKESAEKIIDRYIQHQASIPENMRTTKSELCFSLYESDNGMHGFAVSHRLPFFEDQSNMIMVHMCGDYYYNAFSRSYGYSIRLSPKILEKDGRLKKIEDVKKQFVQRNQKYVGNKKNIDPYLDSLTRMVYEIQKEIVESDFYKGVRYQEFEYLESVRSMVIEKYRETKQGYIFSDNIRYSTGIRSCWYKPPQ